MRAQRTTQGRGLWSAQGLLPVGEEFAYRLPEGKEKAIGSVGSPGRPSPKDALTRDGVRAIQSLLAVPRTAVYDAATAEAVRTRTGSAVLGPVGMRTILLPHIKRLAASAGVSGTLVEGCVRELSDFDPAAQLVEDPERVGLALMPTLGSMNALDPISALEYVANTLRVVYRSYEDRRAPDPWACAVLFLRSPVAAGLLAKTGEYTTIEYRRFVADVLT